MEDLLYLVHRIPFPPNKGDKLRSYHLLKHLAKRYRVHLGTLSDQPGDMQYVNELRPLCAGLHVARLHPKLARLRSLRALFNGEALSLPYYRDAGLAHWVRETVAQQGITKAVVFSSVMAQYVLGFPTMRRIVDFVDVDSAKWTEYSRRHHWPMSLIYRREGERLLAFERAAAMLSDVATFVTPAESKLFASLAPESAAKLVTVQNGVDTEFFAPGDHFTSPYPVEEKAIVFTGAMDYWPNVDAVCWFATDIFPLIIAREPKARFYVVGMSPTPSVQALANGQSVFVTGKVADVRPYLQHARVSVAPLRVARGVQNKVLESMAMERPTVVSTAAAKGISAVPGEEILVAGSAREFADSVLQLIAGGHGQRLGQAARRRVLADYGWKANLARIDVFLDGAHPLVIPGQVVR